MRGEGDDREKTDPKGASGKIYRETSKILQSPLLPDDKSKNYDQSLNE